MQKPYVIIHTHTAIDGNIDVMDLREFEEASRQYQELSLDPEKQQFEIQGYLNGKTSTEDNITFYKKPVLNENADLVTEGDYIEDADAPMYYLSIDTREELDIEENNFSYGDVLSHIIENFTDHE